MVRQRIGLETGQMTLWRMWATTPGRARAVKASERPWNTGSWRSLVAAMSMTSPTRRSSGWMLAVSWPSSMAISRLVSRRSTVKVLPPASTSITWSPRMMCSLWTVTVSVCGSQFSERLPAPASPWAEVTFTAVSV